MALVFKNTDQLWGAVIGQLSDEIQAKVTATAEKPYVHIRPQSKHLGVKDFKYCVEYSSRSAEAYVKVESLNGGEKAKEAIQKFIDCHAEGNILDGVVRLSFNPLNTLEEAKKAVEIINKTILRLKGILN